MRIAVLGNSHVACLKQGWDRIAARHPDLHLSFFASRQEGLKGLRLEGGALVPGDAALARDIAITSGGLERVVLADFDLFLVHALGLAAPAMDLRLSSAVQRQICRDALARSLNMSLCRLIRGASSAPIVIGLNPQRAPDESSPVPRHRLPYGEVCAVLARHVELDNVRLVEQPAHTLANGWNTRDELSRGSTRLDVGDRISNAEHPVNETSHMNAEFGRIYMESVAASLAGYRQASVTA